MDSHSVDIRADLYSLGCTFYYLLTGRVPFPAEGVVDKMLKHHTEEPVPIEQLRPDVPERITTIIRRLMAKYPAQRYATPAGLLEAPDAGRSHAEETTSRRPVSAFGPVVVGFGVDRRDIAGGLVDDDISSALRPVVL